MSPAKALVEQLQHGHLSCSDRKIVHQLRGSQLAQSRLELGRVRELARLLALAEVVDVLRIEVQGVEKQPARRAVGAGVVGIVRKQRVQRVEADEAGATLGPLLEQQPQIGEIAHPPVALGAHRVQLHCRTPDASVRLHGVRLVAGIRRNDQQRFG